MACGTGKTQIFIKFMLNGFLSGGGYSTVVIVAPFRSILGGVHQDLEEVKMLNPSAPIDVMQ